MVRRLSSLEISYTIVFGALSVLLTLLKSFTTFPFPVLTYLKFEAAEIPCILAYFAMGFKPGLASAIVYWMALTPIGEFTPIGPAMKFAAVASLIVGMELGRKLCRKGYSSWNGKTLLPPLVLGAALRIITMSVFNYMVLVILFPEFMDFASLLLRSAGLNPAAQLDVLSLTLILTAVFNLLHSVFTISVSYLVVKTLTRINPSVFRRFKP